MQLLGAQRPDLFLFCRVYILPYQDVRCSEDIPEALPPTPQDCASAPREQNLHKLQLTTKIINNQRIWIMRHAQSLSESQIMTHIIITHIVLHLREQFRLIGQRIDATLQCRFIEALDWCNGLLAGRYFGQNTHWKSDALQPRKWAKN